MTKWVPTDMIVCPTCKGKGYRFNRECLWFTVFFWIPIIIEAGTEFSKDDLNMSRKVCSTCRGKQFITTRWERCDE